MSHDTAYHTATFTLDIMVSYYMARWREEKSRNPIGSEAFMNKALEIADIRDSLAYDDDATACKIIDEYGPIARKFMQTPHQL